MTTIQIVFLTILLWTAGGTTVLYFVMRRKLKVEEKGVEYQRETRDLTAQILDYTREAKKEIKEEVQGVRAAVKAEAGAAADQREEDRNYRASDRAGRVEASQSPGVD